jgi:hypothetical protein
MALSTAAADAGFDRMAQSSLIDSGSTAPHYFSREDARIRVTRLYPSRDA